MKLASILLRMNIRSSLTAFRQVRVRILSFLILLLLLGYNLAVVYLLIQRFQIARAPNTLLPWLLVGVCWLLAGMLSFISTWQYWLNPDRVLYILLLPLRPASLFRSLVLATIVSRAGPRVLLLMSGLLFTLAWRTPLAFVLALIGLALAISCGMVLSWLCFLWITAAPRMQLGSGAGMTIGVGTVIWLILHYSSQFAIPELQGAVFFAVGGGLLLLSLLFFFVCASPLGKLYIITYQKVLSQNRGHTGRHVPGVETLAHVLARYSPVAAALLFKDLSAQSRNNLNFLRVGLFIASAAGFLLLAQFILLPSHRAPVPLVTTYGTILGLYFFLDATPSPIGSEGNRLTHYLSAPSSAASFLWAKFVLYLSAVLGTTLPLCVIVCLWLHLSLSATLLALTAIILVNSGITLTMVWGSTWDEDLHLAIEGGIQAMLYEQLPSTPRRLVVLLTSMLFAGGCLLLVWQSSILPALLILAFFDALLGTLLWRFSQYYLAHLIKQG